MRQIIPEEISKKIDNVMPYMKFVEGKGRVLISDAPQDIVSMKQEIDEWFKEHNRDNY